jgi:hypothetical protein
MDKLNDRVLVWTRTRWFVNDIFRCDIEGIAATTIPPGIYLQVGHSQPHYNSDTLHLRVSDGNSTSQLSLRSVAIVSRLRFGCGLVAAARRRVRVAVLRRLHRLMHLVHLVHRRNSRNGKRCELRRFLGWRRFRPARTRRTR